MLIRCSTGLQHLRQDRNIYRLLEKTIYCWKMNLERIAINWYSPLASELLVTGCIIAVMGTEKPPNGDFEVVDIRVPDLPPQPEEMAYLTDLPESHGPQKEDQIGQ